MAGSSYEFDFLAWSDQQAELLERLARGERVNEAVDWPHLIDEVRDLGRSELRSVSSLLTRALEHLLKIAGWPVGPVDHWSVAALTFLLDARRNWAPSMARNIAVSDLYADALKVVRRMTIDGTHASRLPDECPFTLADLIVDTSNGPDIDHLVAAVLAMPPLP